MQLSSTELRTLVAAQIASGLVGHVDPASPQATIDEVAQLAVRIAKALQDAAVKSMHQKETPPSQAGQLRPGASPEKSSGGFTGASSGRVLP
ncbi:MAG TPA: hypothetical protein VNZ53_03765 [Steroidobacteraceae bacterium]|jgi:hypothetical protein|nr:hypothetical protein [Steroidobacteraceae bacterium]